MFWSSPWELGLFNELLLQVLLEHSWKFMQTSAKAACKSHISIHLDSHISTLIDRPRLNEALPDHRGVCWFGIGWNTPCAMNQYAGVDQLSMRGIVLAAMLVLVLVLAERCWILWYLYPHRNVFWEETSSFSKIRVEGSSQQNERPEFEIGTIIKGKLGWFKRTKT